MDAEEAQMEIRQSISWLARTALDRVLRVLPTRRMDPPAPAYEPGSRRHKTSKLGASPGAYIMRRAARLLRGESK